MGTYTVVATTYWRELSTGDYRLHIRSVEGPLPPPSTPTPSTPTPTTPPATTPGPTATPAPTPAPSTPCSMTDMGTRSTVFGRWSAGDCFSSRAPSGRYADFYTFTVIGTSRRTVTIGLQASTLSDAYLYLISGSSGKGTSYLESDDDSGGNRNARITRSLAPGTYTIEATTHRRRSTGSHIVSVSGHR